MIATELQQFDYVNSTPRSILYGMELSPPLFPDLLDEYENRQYESHVFCIETIHSRRPRREPAEMRCLVVYWEGGRTYVEPLPVWCVEIVHYIYNYVTEGSGNRARTRLNQVMRHTNRRFDIRADAVRFAERVLQRMQNVLAAQYKLDNPEGNQEGES